MMPPNTATTVTPQRGTNRRGNNSNNGNNQGHRTQSPKRVRIEDPEEAYHYAAGAGTTTNSKAKQKTSPMAAAKEVLETRTKSHHEAITTIALPLAQQLLSYRHKAWLKKQAIKKMEEDVIAKLREQSAEAMGIDAQWVLQRLYAGVTADLADLFDEHNALKSMDRWPQVWRQGLIAGFESEEIRDDEGNAVGVMRKVKLADRTKLLEMIGKHIKIKAFQENVAIAGVSELAERLNRAAKAIEAEQSMTMIEHQPGETG